MGGGTNRGVLGRVDPVEAPVGISGEANAVVTGELGRSLHVRCLAYGFPPPAIYWYRGRTMLPYSSELYEARGNVLQIRKLDVDTLGEYACQAYNGIGKAAKWAVLVKAYDPNSDEASPPTTFEPDTEVPSYAGEDRNVLL
jgi:papilin